MDLLDKLRARLQGYAKWLPTNARIVVLVDRDDDDCAALKEQLECDSAAAGLVTRGGGGDAVWRVVNRIAIFGEWAGVRKAYPRAAANVPNQAPYRHCDAIAGGTWEALERVLKRGGYFSGGLRKVEAAREIGKHLDHAACTSPSFAAFRDALIEASA